MWVCFISLLLGEGFFSLTYADFIILQVMNESCSLLFLVSFKMGMKLSLPSVNIYFFGFEYYNKDNK